MTCVSPATGKIIHHNDCTWCKHRIVYSRGTVNKKREVEKCAITGKYLTWPNRNDRYCEYYQQTDCECDNCKNQNTTVQNY